MLAFVRTFVCHPCLRASCSGARHSCWRRLDALLSLPKCFCCSPRVRQASIRPARRRVEILRRLLSPDRPGPRRVPNFLRPRVLVHMHGRHGGAAGCSMPLRVSARSTGAPCRLLGSSLVRQRRDVQAECRTRATLGGCDTRGIWKGGTEALCLRGRRKGLGRRRSVAKRRPRWESRLPEWQPSPKRNKWKCSICSTCPKRAVLSQPRASPARRAQGA